MGPIDVSLLSWNVVFLWGFCFGSTCTLAGVGLAWWALRE